MGEAKWDADVRATSRAAQEAQDTLGRRSPVRRQRRSAGRGLPQMTQTPASHRRQARQNIPKKGEQTWRVLPRRLFMIIVLAIYCYNTLSAALVREKRPQNYQAQARTRLRKLRPQDKAQEAAPTRVRVTRAGRLEREASTLFGSVFFRKPSEEWRTIKRAGKT